MLEKLNCHVVRVSIFLIMVALIAGMVGCASLSQNLEIWTWYDLDAVRNNLGGHHILMNDLDSTTAGYTELASPTANGGKGWQPIGNFPYEYAFKGFAGTFDGQGYEIRDLYINRTGENSIGLFGYVDEGGTIKNIIVMNATVTSGGGVGGLVALNEEAATVNSLVGTLPPGAAVGGLAGYNRGTVSNSHVCGSVTGGGAVGGLVGLNQGTVSSSYFSGNVTGGDAVGNLVGYNRGTITNSYSRGNVTGYSSSGCLVGLNEGTVSNSYYNYGEVLINGENIVTIGALFNEDFEEWLANDKFLDVNDRLSQENGYYIVNNVTDFKELLAFGQNASLKFSLKNDLDLATEPNFYIPYLAGEFDGNGHRISNLSFDFGFVSQVGLFGYLASEGKVSEVGVGRVNITVCVDVGGLVGYSHGAVSNSYSSGNVIGGWYVGGLVGRNYQGTVSNSYSMANMIGDWDVGGLVGFSAGNVSNSYSTGGVTGNWGVGGLVGSNYGIVSNSFWNMQTSGQTTSSGGTGKTTAEMKNIATFSEAWWDIDAVNPGETNTAYIWNIVNGVTYPFLSWQS
jgi:hypothetical protein